MTDEELESLASEVLAVGMAEEQEVEVVAAEPAVEEKRLPTHEELRAQGINLPDWVPVEDIIWDRVAELQQEFAFEQLIEAYRERKLKAKA